MLDSDVRRVLSMPPSGRSGEELDKLQGLMLRELGSFREFPQHMHRSLATVATYAQ